MDYFNELKEIIESRRSIYPPSFTGETITQETISNILNCARWAPTHRKTEPWRFKIYAGAAKDSLKSYFDLQFKKQIDSDKYSAQKHKRSLQKFDLTSHNYRDCAES